MSRLSHLLRQVERSDPQLAADLAEEVRALSQRRPFGLNFERHIPETVELYGRPVRKGDKVRCLPPRGESTKDADRKIWAVAGVARLDGKRVAKLVPLEPEADEDELVERALDDLVVVAEFRDPIYPGLASTGKVERGGDKPFHTVINGENFHALQLLLYTHEGKVDAIYIDPPYNTGGKTSWLYNDHYVDADDDFRHSKWLAFMERRLKMSRRLLSDAGVIFVSIDDAEQHRLRMLLDQVFGELNFVDTLAVEMSTTSGPKTVNAQQGTIVKNIEFVHIYRKGPGFDRVPHTPLVDGVASYDTHYTLWLNEDGTLGSLSENLLAEPTIAEDIDRLGLDRSGTFSIKQIDTLLAASRAANDFILANLDRIARLDRPPVSAGSETPPMGGYVEFKASERTYLLTTLKNGTVQQVVPLALNYRTSDDYKPRFGRTVIRGDLWKGFHQDMGNVAKEGGVAFGNGKKPVRLIKQLIRWANNSPDAVVVDFFAGSGTTADAVMAMNSEDGGHRRAIVVTNNEVAAEVRTKLQRLGLRPTDPDWESSGVHEAVTRPRLINAASATDTNENLEFFTMTYEAPRAVAHHRSFEAIAPLLWLKAGARGRRIEKPSDDFAVTDAYAVLFDTDSSGAFLAALQDARDVGMVFIVTDDDRAFQMICAELPAAVEPVRLYSSYLTNFSINAGRS
ncbi:MAG: hypothetical protein QOJ29_2732 [Thermoleophilaceae bacterium]|jgi:adenine-specific DNA-methyltransferase|nr:hypothetical protein [Thermoleophilaceae bacterium]